MKLKISCRYSDCGYEGDAEPYVRFFSHERFRIAHERDPYMPKYGVHLGVDCPECDRHQGWMTQTDDNMMSGRFVHEEPTMDVKSASLFDYAEPPRVSWRKEYAPGRFASIWLRPNGVEYDIDFPKTAASAMELVHHMSEKNWVTTRMVRQFIEEFYAVSRKSP
jgi:hypothetical protein